MAITTRHRTKTQSAPTQTRDSKNTGEVRNRRDFLLTDSELKEEKPTLLERFLNVVEHNGTHHS